MVRPSSDAGPELICSGSARVPPSEKRCRQIWKAPPARELKNIQFPSGDQAANQHAAPGGPTGRPVDLPSIGTSLHGSQVPRSVISANRTHLPSGDGYDRCAIAPLGIGI